MKKNEDLKLIFAKAELAKKVEVSPSFITEIENGRKAPSFSNIEKFSKVLNAPAWSFFIENENNFEINYSKNDLDSFELKNKIELIIDDFFNSK